MPREKARKLWQDGKQQRNPLSPSRSFNPAVIGMVYLRYELLVKEGTSAKKGYFSAVAELYLGQEDWNGSQIILL